MTGNKKYSVCHSIHVFVYNIVRIIESVGLVNSSLDLFFSFNSVRLIGSDNKYYDVVIQI